MERLDRWNRFRYKLMGSPEYCKECGHELGWKEYDAEYSELTGNKTRVCIRLGCIWRDNRHTHILFWQSAR